MSTEKVSHHQFTWQELAKSNTHFHIDRPLLNDFNAHDDCLLDLLKGEIAELNGKDKEGYFATDEKREEYRQQEVSDIILFSLEVLERLGYDPDQKQIEARVQQIAGELEISLVAYEQPLSEITVFDARQSAKYEFLRQTLNRRARVFEPTVWKFIDDEDKASMLHEVISYCSVIHSLLGVNTVRATYEKIARNLLKYPAYLFQYQARTSSAESLSSDKAALADLFMQQAALAKKQWDGVSYGDTFSPQTGTRDFYGAFESERSQQTHYQGQSWSLARPLTRSQLIRPQRAVPSWNFNDGRGIVAVGVNHE